VDQKNIEAIYPLSPLQQGLLFHALYEPQSEQYFQQLNCTLEGRLDAAAFERSWRQVVERHAVLRTVFLGERRDKPLQVVRQRVDLPFEVLDWRGRDGGEQRRMLEEWLAADRRRGFDLTQAPLMRVTLMRVADETHYLVWSIHHLLIDGWSMPLVFKEVRAFYESFSAGRELRLERPRPYVEYIKWLQRQDMGRAEAYWRQTLKGFTSATPVGIGKGADEVEGEGEGYGAVKSRLDEGASAALQSMARQHQLTLSTLVQGAWALLLSRYSGEEDVVFGVTVSGRPADLPGVETMVGPFINTLPVRVRVEPGAPALEWMKGLQAQLVEMRQYEYSPLAEVQRWSEAGHGQPLFESIFIFENYPAGEAVQGGGSGSGPGISVSSPSTFEKSNYPVLVGAAPGDRLWLEIDYDNRRFEAAQVERMMRHFEALLRALAADPARRVGELPMLAEDERGLLLRGRNETRAGHPLDKCAHELFEEQAARTPGAAALVWPEGSLTYAELDARANRLANHLRRRGVGPETRVGLLAERSAEAVTAMLAVFKAGGAYVPLDPAYPAERLSFMLEDAGVRLLLTRTELLPVLPGHAAEVVCLDADAEAISRESAQAPAPAAAPDGLAYLIYTSGSTGRPKAVMVEHRNLVQTLLAGREKFGFEAPDVMPCLAALSFDISLFEILTPLLGGAAALVVPRQDVLDMERLVGCLRGATMLHAVPSLMRQIVEHVKSRPEAAGALKGLRRVFIGGDAVAPEILREMRRAFPEARIAVLYGPTEATIICTSHEVPRDAAVAERLLIGRPLPNARVAILDRAGEVVPVGVAGEIYVGGGAVARGYLNRPELTGEKFVTVGGERHYRSGDLGRWLAGGEIEFLGRADNQVKVRGFRIEPGEVEAALSQHPGVRETAVVAREGEAGDKRLVAYVVAEAGAQPHAAELREHLRGLLPDYMTPSAFVALDALPLSANGKVDRRALLAPEAARTERLTPFVEPRTPAERALAEVWSQLLGVERVSVHDNFFELGGDSILSIQVVARAQQAGLRLTPKQLFQHQTIAELAEAVGTADLVEAEQGTVSGDVRLTPIQRQFFEAAADEPWHFNQAVLLESDEELEAGALRRAVEALLAHHDALRMRYRREEGGGWRQECAPAEVNDVVWLRQAAEADGGDAGRAVAAVAEEAQRSLSLEEGPLVRCVYVKGGAGRSGRLLIVIHHLVVDGVSWRILLEDLSTAYGQARRGEAVRLGPKTTSYRRWAERLDEYAHTAAAEAEADYWLAETAREFAPPPADFSPADAGAANTVASARKVSVSLGEEETRALLTEVPKRYRTRIDEVLLAALARAYSRWGGGSGLLVDVEGHGREEEVVGGVDLSRTVGWFTSVYPLALESREGEGEDALVGRVKEKVRGVPGRGIGYGVLRYLGPEGGAGGAGRALSLQPKAGVSFNYLGQLDQALPAQGVLRAAAESSGEPLGPRVRRRYALEINGGISEGRLRLSWSYSEALHRRESVERFAAEYLSALRSIIGRCGEESPAPFTPSDFPLAQLTPAALDRLSGRGRQVEDVYALSAMQQGMLFHSLTAPDSEAYYDQMSCTLGGGFDPSAFERAWREVLGRHAALRTSFLWEGLDEPAQVVWREVPLPLALHDWRGLPAGEQGRRLEGLLEAERRGGFGLSEAPLMRLTLARLGEDSYQLVWSWHHLLLDGWSLSVVLKEVFELYEAHAAGGGAAALKGARPYRDYIAWLSGREQGRAESYWRERLRGFDGPTPLALDPDPVEVNADGGGKADGKANGKADGGGRSDGQGAGARESFERRLLTLPAGTTTALSELARRSQLTLNTFVQGAWAFVLGHCSGTDDVVFGVTVSGRPAELAGVEEIVGLFINTLPLRARLDAEQGALEWLRDLQGQSVELRQYEESPLVEVQRWAGAARGVPLFESIVVFENYPFDQGLRERAAGLRVENVRTVDWNNYPLCVTATPGAELTVEIKHDRRRLPAAAADRAARLIEAFLGGLAAEPEASLRSLRERLEAEDRRARAAAESEYQDSLRRKLQGIRRRGAGRQQQQPERS